MTVTVTSDIDMIIQQHVASGRFASASEVVAAGVRLLGQNETLSYPDLDTFRAEMQRRLDEAHRGDALADGTTVWAELQEDAHYRRHLTA